MCSCISAALHTQHLPHTSEFNPLLVQVTSVPRGYQCTPGLPVYPGGTLGKRMPEADGRVDEQKARFGSHLRTFCENCTADA